MRFERLLFVIAATSALGCSRKTPEADFSCENLQQRALRCEQDTLDLIQRRIKSAAADGATPDGERQFAMLERRFRTRLRSGGTRKQCEKFSTPADPARLERMKSCYAKSGCVLFAECLLELEE